MKALVYSGYRVRPEVMAVADPVCPADGVVIAVGANQTQPGFTRPGSFAELVAVHAAAAATRRHAAEIRRARRTQRPRPTASARRSFRALRALRIA